MPAKYYVVDGDLNADIYGEAYSAEEALEVAESCFADCIDRVELYGPITLSSGEVLPKAYVAFTRKEGFAGRE